METLGDSCEDDDDEDDTELRQRIDPERRYLGDGFRTVEHLALLVLKYLPEAEVTRTRDVIQLDHGGERGIVVLITPEAIEVRLPTIEWTKGAYGPAKTSRLWKRIAAGKLVEAALPAPECDK